MAKKVNIICVGKLKEQFLKDGISEYAKRLSRFCDFSILELADYSDSALSVEKESALILSKLSGAYNILTDLDGEQVSLTRLADILDKAYLNGYDTVNFIIGGSNGVNASVKSAADKQIAFGKITYPHQLMRLILSEQIYRAFNILNNTPYHK